MGFADRVTQVLDTLEDPVSPIVQRIDSGSLVLLGELHVLEGQAMERKSSYIAAILKAAREHRKIQFFANEYFTWANRGALQQEAMGALGAYGRRFETALKAAKQKVAVLAANKEAPDVRLLAGKDKERLEAFVGSVASFNKYLTKKGFQDGRPPILKPYVGVWLMGAAHASKIQSLKGAIGSTTAYFLQYSFGATVHSVRVMVPEESLLKEAARDYVLESTRDDEGGETVDLLEVWTKLGQRNQYVKIAQLDHAVSKNRDLMVPEEWRDRFDALVCLGPSWAAK
jgi:hypothetical protein